jgi:Chromosome segregation ATPases
MMDIKRVRLTGFKSFVDPTELRIERGMTGIVGPNGCGKSNMLEALRWAMGENRAKTMRGDGMEDVIFAGTDRRNAKPYAEVSLLLHCSTILTDDDGDVTITRRIQRGAGSSYRINGRETRARDVQHLFADAATGAHSSSLVRQGQVSQLIQAKPIDRRIILEEAAGIAGLQGRRKEAEQKLRGADENLDHVTKLIDE